MRSQRGMTMISVLVATVLLAILATEFIRWMTHSLKGQDVLRSGAEMSDIDWTMGLITHRAGTCEKSGLVGLMVDPNNPQSAQPEIHLPAAAGPGAAFLKEGTAAPGSKWTTTSLRFTNLTLVEPDIYFATLQIVGSYRDGAPQSESTAKKSVSREYHFEIALDSAKKIVRCGSNALGQKLRAGNLHFDPTNTATLVTIPGPLPTTDGVSTAKVVAKTSSGASTISFTPTKNCLRLRVTAGYGYDSKGSSVVLYVAARFTQSGALINTWNIVAAARVTPTATDQWLTNVSEATGLTAVTPNVPINIEISAFATCNAGPSSSCTTPDPNTSNAVYRVWSAVAYEIAEYDDVSP